MNPNTPNTPPRLSLLQARLMDMKVFAKEHGLGPYSEHDVQQLIDALATRSENARIEWKPGDRRVVCAAIRSSDNVLICAPRHWDNTMAAQAAAFGGDWSGAEQGFMDQFGKFMTREEALHVALANGQILRRCGGDDHELFSENLY